MESCRLMGVYTWVSHSCCDHKIEFQSKACQEMEWGEHDIDAVPVEVARDIQGQVEKCYKCGKEYRIDVVPFPLSSVPMKVSEV